MRGSPARIRMQPVLLHQLGVQRHAIKQERHERQMILVCQRRGISARTPRCSAARSWAAGACRPAAPAPPRPATAHHLRQVLPRAAVSGSPRRPSLAPSSRITSAGRCISSARGSRCRPPLRRLAAHAGVDDLVPVPLRVQVAAPAARPNPVPAGCHSAALRLSPSTRMVRSAATAFWSAMNTNPCPAPRRRRPATAFSRRKTSRKQVSSPEGSLTIVDDVSFDIAAGRVGGHRRAPPARANPRCWRCSPGSTLPTSGRVPLAGHGPDAAR